MKQIKLLITFFVFSFGLEAYTRCVISDVSDNPDLFAGLRIGYVEGLTVYQDRDGPGFGLAGDDIGGVENGVIWGGRNYRGVESYKGTTRDGLIWKHQGDQPTVGAGEEVGSIEGNKIWQHHTMGAFSGKEHIGNISGRCSRQEKAAAALLLLLR